MSGWGIFGIVAGSIVILILILITIPVSIVLDLSGTKILVSLRYTFIKKELYPGKPRAEKKKKTKEENKQKVIKEEKDEKQSLSDIIELISDVREIASPALKRLKNHIKVRVEDYDILVAGFEASTTALLYGGLQMVFGNLFSVLEQSKWFSVSDKCKGINADFLQEKAHVSFRLSASMSAIGAVVVLLPAVVKYISNKKGEKNSGKQL